MGLEGLAHVALPEPKCFEPDALQEPRPKRSKPKVCALLRFHMLDGFGTDLVDGRPECHVSSVLFVSCIQCFNDFVWVGWTGMRNVLSCLPLSWLVERTHGFVVSGCFWCFLSPGFCERHKLLHEFAEHNASELVKSSWCKRQVLKCHIGTFDECVQKFHSEFFERYKHQDLFLYCRMWQWRYGGTFNLRHKTVAKEADKMLKSQNYSNLKTQQNI